MVPVSGCCLIIGVFSLPGTTEHPPIIRKGHFGADSPESGLGLLEAGCCLAKLGTVEVLLIGGGRLGSKTKLEVEGELLMGGAGGGCLGSKLKLDSGGEALIVGCCLCSNPPTFGVGEDLLMGCCCCLCSKQLIGMGEELVTGG
jgi:hypothetical protein